MLGFTEDKYDGVTVELKENMAPADFVGLLKVSMEHWRQHGKKGVWIKLPLHLSSLVDPAVKEGFWYHHAEREYLMLVHWIPQSKNTLPCNANHRVGIGAFVTNGKGDVLVVQEKYGYFKGTGVWKFPTGVVEEGEDIAAAAVREVKEETGVETEFVEVLAFRQSHKAFFNKSDMFFLCMLTPLAFDIQKQEGEIEGAQWLPFKEYESQAYVRNHQQFKYTADICSAKMKGSYSGFSVLPTTTSSGKKIDLYMNRSGESHLSNRMQMDCGLNLGHHGGCESEPSCDVRRLVPDDGCRGRSSTDGDEYLRGHMTKLGDRRPEWMPRKTTCARVMLFFFPLIVCVVLSFLAVGST